MGTSPNTAEAIKWLSGPAKKGNEYAQVFLGMCYLQGEEGISNTAEAIKWCLVPAEKGNVEAQVLLGICYLKDGVSRNAAEAAKWLLRPAEKGNVEAQVLLGICYRDGDGVKKDVAKAIYWLRKASAQGHKKAKALLEKLEQSKALITKRGESRPKDKWELRAISNRKALAKVRRNGIDELKNKADAGDANAQFLVGMCYSSGIGVKTDYQEALKWFQKAEQQGDEDACFMIAGFYYTGTVFEKNYYEGVKRFKKLADKGDPRAFYQLGRSYFMLLPCRINLKASIGWEFAIIWGWE